MAAIVNIMDDALYSMLADRKSSNGVYVKMNKRLDEDYRKAFSHYDKWLARMKATHKDNPRIVEQLEILHQHLRSYK